MPFKIHTKRLYRPHSLTWACQAILQISWGKPSLRFTMARLFLAGNLYAWDASISARRTWLFPVLVICPGLLLSPLLCWEGTRPRYAMNFEGESKRVRSPISDTTTAETICDTPRNDCSDRLRVFNRLCPDKCMICSEIRSTRLLSSWTISIYSCNVICCAGCGIDMSASQLK